mmetsp:Transcript_24144/g.34601  ORF Transcript_24144/g.34601 Transcript_24144/m.34601 type:complete len:140 (-) Transcript_24144:406-825(-)
MDGCVDDNILSCCSGTVRTIPCYSLDNHANVCIFANPFLLENLRDLKRVGDHPIFKTVFVDPRNKYNLVGEPIIRKHGMQINRGKDDLYKDLVRKSDGKIVMRFHLDHRDGFYKAPFSNAKVRYAAPSDGACQQGARAA